MYIVTVTLSLIIRKYTTNKNRVSHLIMRAQAGPISDLESAYPSANKTIRLRDDVVQGIFALNFFACGAGNGRGHRGIDRWREHKTMVEYSWQALNDLVG